jgi:hypothetical protein
VGKAVGTTDIKASVSSFTATSGPVTVVKPTFEWVSVPTQMTLGAAQGVYMQTYVLNGSYYWSSSKYGNPNQDVDQALTVSLSSENPAVLQVPATAMIAAGDNYTSFNVQAVAMGTSTLTASATGWGNGTSETITVVAPQLWIKADVTVGAGTQTTGVVGLTDEEASAGGYTINLASSDPSIATVPATVTIPEEEIGATFVITGKALGTADITASVAQVTVASAVTVVKPTFEWSQVPTETITGATSNVEIGTHVPGGSYYDYYYWDTYKYFDSAQPVGQTLTVSLSSEDPAVIQVPATITITPGNNYGSFEIQAVVTGTSALTASAPGWDSKTSERITVVGPQLWIKADVTVGTGTRTTGAVGLTDAWAPSGGYTINLTSSDPSIASVPSTVTIPYGAGGTIFTIIGNAVGNTEVIASVPGSTATSGPVAVVKSRLDWNYVPMEMTVGTLDVSLMTYVPGGSSYYYYDYWGAYKYFSPAQPLDQTATVSLSSDDPAVIQVPSTATIEAGSAYTTPPDIQAVGIGTSRLTASAPGWDSSTTEAITVTAALAGLWIRADVVAGAGMQTTGAVGFAGPDAPAGEYTINLTNSDPSIVSAPESVTIREGYSSAMFTIVGKAGGTADITASVADHTATSSVTVVTPTFEWEDVPTEMVLYDSVETRVRTYVPNGSYSYYSNGGIYKYPYPNQNVDRTVTVSLSSENPAVIQVPASRSILGGDDSTNYIHFDILAVGTGTSAITASAPGWDSATTETITVK